MTFPTLAEIRVWVQVSPTQVSDDALQQVVDAEVTSQAISCRVPLTPLVVPPVPDLDAYPPDLVAAVVRRVARHLAARAIPTGMVGGGEFGLARLPMIDAEIARLEGPRTMVVFG